MKGDITIRQPDDREFEEVKRYVEEFWLDNSNMLKEQFTILLYKNKLVAFGRLREHKDATELCTLGVVEEFRGKQFGTTLVRNMVMRDRKTVHLVTVIPDFFSKLGFKEVVKYPESISKKIHLCVTQYHVDEPYRVMKYNLPIHSIKANSVMRHSHSRVGRGR